MLCDPFTSATCIGSIAGSIIGDVAGPVVGAAASSAVSGLESAIEGALSAVVKGMITFWVSIPSPDIATNPVPRLEQQWLLPITIFVALIGFITAGIRMALTRKVAPLAEVGTGLVTVAAASAAGTLAPELMLKASDAFSSYVLNAATGGQFQHRFGLLLAGTAGVAPGLVIILGIVAVIMSAIQAVLLVFRLGAVIVLSGTLPLAAAGQLTPRTKPWLWKVLGWELSLIWYKAAAALVYAAGFALIGTPGSGTIGFLMGIAVLLLSLVALPALMKFFNWTTGELQQSGGGGFLGTAAGAMQAAGAMRSFGMSPSGQASAVNGSLGSAGGGPGGPQPGGPQPGGPQAGGRPGGGSSGGSTTAASSAGTSAAAGSGTATSAGASTAAAAGGTSAAGGAAASGASGAAAGAGAAAGPVGMVVIGGGQMAAGAGRQLADGAAPPSERS